MVLLNADLTSILASIPDGTTIKLRKTIDRYAGSLLAVTKRNGSWFDAVGRPYPTRKLLTDVANKRISLPELLSYAAVDLNVSDDGKLVAYNVDLDGDKRQLPSDAMILFRETMPKALVDAGLADEPAKITKYVYDKVTARVRNWKRNAHGLTDSMLDEIRDALDHPVAIIRSKAKDGSAALVVVTRVRDSHGDLAELVIQQDKARGDNWISSIYGRSNFVNWFGRQVDAGAVLSVDDQQMSAFMSSQPDEDAQKLKDAVSRFHAEDTRKTSMAEIMRKAKGRHQQ